jgi:hypothetical protein
MPRSPEEQIRWELQAMGVTKRELLDSKPEFVSDLMYAMMILSDAQEEINFAYEAAHRIPNSGMIAANIETGRQFINRAKMFISDHMQEMGTR